MADDAWLVDLSLNQPRMIKTYYDGFDDGTKTVDQVLNFSIFVTCVINAMSLHQSYVDTELIDTYPHGSILTLATKMINNVFDLTGQHAILKGEGTIHQ